MNNISNQYSAGHQYEPVTNTAKELKAKKEAGGTAFGAQVLAQSLDIEIRSKAKQISHKNIQVASSQIVTNQSLQTNINSIKFSVNAYGYSVDSNGFMGSDFNKAAGLPENFKIHKSSLDEFVRHATQDNNINGHLFCNVTGKLFGNDVFESIDIANTIGQYYNVFSQIMGDNLKKDTFTDADLAALPKGYSSQNAVLTDFGGNLKDEKNINFLNDRSREVVTNIYMNNFNEAHKLQDDLKQAGVKFDLRSLNFTSKSLQTSTMPNRFGFNPDMSFYENAKGYTKEALFMSFLKSENPAILEGGNTKLKDSVLANNMIIATETAKFRNFRAEIAKIEEIMEDFELLKELIRENIKNGAIDTDLQSSSKIANELYDRIHKIYGGTRLYVS